MRVHVQRTLVEGQEGDVQAGAEAPAEPGSPAEGAAVHIPLLQRCRTRIALQAARFPQADLPSIKLQLGASPASAAGLPTGAAAAYAAGLSAD